MRFLLTSAGIKNTSIHNALVDLLGKPIAESSALCIPTGVQPFPGGPSHVYRFISGSTPSPMCELGWKSLGVLELTALPSIKEEIGLLRSRRLTPCWCGAASPCICAAGCGSPDWQTSCRRWRETVYVGMSGGAMVATPEFGGVTYDDSDPLTAAIERWDWLISRCPRTWTTRTTRKFPGQH